MTRQTRLNAPLRTVDGSATYVASTKPEKYGAKGDGTTDDTTAVQAALTAAAGGECRLEGAYKITGSGLTLPSRTRIVFKGSGAKLIYTGTGACVTVANQRYIDWTSGTIDLSGAGSSAIGLWIRGCWNSTWHGLEIVGDAHPGTSTLTGIKIETSAVGGNEYGSYVLRFEDLHMRDSTFGVGIDVSQTSGDTASKVTHLSIDDGWLLGCGVGLKLRKAEGVKVRGTVFEMSGSTFQLGTNGIDIAACFNITLEPGEIGTYGGYGVYVDPANAGAVYLSMPSENQIGGVSGYINATAPVIYRSRQQLRVSGSVDVTQKYYAELRADINYWQAARLLMAGGGPIDTVLEYGDAMGLIVRGATNSGKLVIVDNVLQLGNTANSAHVRSGTGTPQGTLGGTAGIDWYLRTDTPSIASQRLYICTVTGANAAATTWVGIV